MLDTSCLGFFSLSRLLPVARFYLWHCRRGILLLFAVVLACCSCCCNVLSPGEAIYYNMFFLAATNNATQFSCCAFPYRARAVHFAKLSSSFLHIRLLFMGTATLITLFFGELTF